MIFAQQFPVFYNNDTLPKGFAISPGITNSTDIDLIKLEQYVNSLRNTEAQKIELPGLNNFYKVSDALYRGAQPDRQGYEELAKLGIKTVISLQVIPHDKKFIKSLGMNPVHIPINPLDMKDKYSEKFLSIMANPKNHPVYVHCRYGSDRTGTMVALYRIYIQHWTKQSALTEMRDDKYGFREIFLNLKQYIRQVDIPFKYTPQDTTPVITQKK